MYVSVCISVWTVLLVSAVGSKWTFLVSLAVNKQIYGRAVSHCTGSIYIYTDIYIGILGYWDIG